MTLSHREEKNAVMMSACSIIRGCQVSTLSVNPTVGSTDSARDVSNMQAGLRPVTVRRETLLTTGSYSSVAHSLLVRVPSVHRPLTVGQFWALVVLKNSRTSDRRCVQLTKKTRSPIQ